jgi:acetyl esterase/lipase
LQAADLYLPLTNASLPAASLPVVVVIHGGYWSPPWNRAITAALASALAGRGWAAWNVDYRSLGQGGGWPGTFDDVAAGVDELASLVTEYPQLDLSRVAAVGHSAGGPLALWAAARPKLPAGAPGANPKVTVRGVASLSGVDDLGACADSDAGDGACRRLLGGTPQTAPRRFALADPMQLVPLHVPQLVLNGLADATVSPDTARRYAARAAASGDRVQLALLPGVDHNETVVPRGAPWATLVAALRPMFLG